MDCFVPNAKLKYEDLENIIADRVNTVVFKLHHIKRRACFLGHSVVKCVKNSFSVTIFVKT